MACFGFEKHGDAGSTPANPGNLSSAKRAGFTMIEVLVVLVLLCINAESRDYLLGHGKTLSIVSLGMLLLVLGMTVVGWSVTY